MAVVAGTNLGLWIPPVVLAHLFALFWLLKSLKLIYPGALSSASWRRRLARITRHGSSPVHHPRSISQGVPLLKDLDTACKGQAEYAGITVTSRAQLCQQQQEQPDSMAMLDQAGLASGSNQGDTRLQVAHAYDKRQPHLQRSRSSLMLEWRDLGCSYRSRGGGEVVVLRGVYGYITPGTMTAVLGPSGSGKSTLLDILAQRKTQGCLTGQVLANGLPAAPADLKGRLAYVPQHEALLPTLTARETLQYYAQLTLPDAVSPAELRARVEEVLLLMGLSKQGATLVGGMLPGGIALRGLSGGERKRVWLASGLLPAPSGLLLDEPTSGLDAAGALGLALQLRSMALQGRCVLAAVHQPRAALWNMFDYALLLSCGRMIYFGPREGLVAWFSSLTYEWSARHGNVADWAMDLVNVGFDKGAGQATMSSRQQLEQASAQFAKQHVISGSIMPPELAHLAAPANGKASHLRASSTGAEHSSDHAPAPVGMDGTGGQLTASSSATACPAASTVQQPLAASPQPASTSLRSSASRWARQYRALTWREYLAITRNPADVAGRMLVYIWLALFVGLVFYGLGTDVDSLRQRLNVIFVDLTIFLLLPYVYMSLYTADKQYYVADLSARKYPPHAFYAAKLTAVVPFALANIAAFSLTVYGMAGLNRDPTAVVVHVALSLLLYLNATQVLYLAAVVTSSQDLAFVLAIAWSALNLLMSGFQIRFDDFSAYWISYLRYLAVLPHVLAGAVRAEMAGQEFDCSGGLPQDMVTAVGDLLPTVNLFRSDYVQNLLRNPGPDCKIYGDQMMEYFGFSGSSTGKVFGIVLGYLGVVHLLTYVAVVVVTRKERR